MSKEETDSQELKDLRDRLLTLKKTSKNESEISYLRGAINHYEIELGLDKTRWNGRSSQDSGRGIVGAFTNLKLYLVETKTWLSFKLILFGISFFYAGVYTGYGSFGPLFELVGIVCILFGVWRIPFVKDFFKEAW